MNPFRESAPPVVEYNKTEVELARIRETEETKRKIAIEREKTKQATREHDGFWLIRAVTAVAVVLVSLFGYWAYTEHLHVMHPASSCVETAELINGGTSKRTCDNGGWLETTPNGSEVLVRCHCSPKPGASAAPSASAP